MEHLKQQLKHTDLMPKKPTTPPPADGIEAAKRRAESPEFRPTHDHSSRRATFLAAAVIVPLLAITGAGIYAVTQLGGPRTTIQPATSSTATGPALPGAETATIGDVTVTCEPLKFPSQGFLAVAEQQGTDTAVTFLPAEGSSFGARWTGLEKPPTTADELSSGKIVAVWTLPNPDLPSPHASVIPSAWKALAEGKQPNKEGVSYDVNDSAFHDRMFDYAKYTLADPAESASTRCNALKALARIDAKAKIKVAGGKTVVRVTPKRGLPMWRGQDDIITVDITTGRDTSTQPFTTFTVDSIPSVVTDTFNKVKGNGELCNTFRNSTYCSTP